MVAVKFSAAITADNYTAEAGIVCKEESVRQPPADCIVIGVQSLMTGVTLIAASIVFGGL